MTTKNIFVCTCGECNIDRVICWNCGNPALPISPKKPDEASAKEPDKAPEENNPKPQMQKPSVTVAPTRADPSPVPATGFLAVLILIVSFISLPLLISLLPKSPVAQIPTPTVTTRPSQAADPAPPRVIIPKAVALPPPPQLLDATPSAILPPAIPAVRASDDANPPALDLIVPAPGCPQKFPTYASAQALCNLLDEKGCTAAERNCKWNKAWSWADKVYPAKCAAKSGTYVSPPPIDPAVGARQGLISADYTIATTEELARRISKADTLVVKKRFARAVAEYTAALKYSSDHLPALIGRARAYQGDGDKARAIADYCRILVVGSNYQTYNMVVQQVARLSGLSSAADQQPGPSAASVTDLKPAPSPPTSVIEKGRRRKGIAPFKIETEAGADYLLKLVSTTDENDNMIIFVRGGEIYSSKMPLGTYKIRGATGSTWYSKEAFFGPATRFFRLQDKNGKGPEASTIIRFWQERNKIFGMTLILKNVVGGNMAQEPISRDEF
jgi:hypothetical protein